MTPFPWEPLPINLRFPRRGQRVCCITGSEKEGSAKYLKGRIAEAVGSTDPVHLFFSFPLATSWWMEMSKPEKTDSIPER